LIVLNVIGENAEFRKALGAQKTTAMDTLASAGDMADKTGESEDRGDVTVPVKVVADEKSF
jgi:hypothetical protein